MKKGWMGLLFGLGVVALAGGQQQFNGVCTPVKMEILQELSLERVGFLATLEVTNNDGADPITDFSAQLTFEDPYNPEGGGNELADWFFVRVPELENISDVDGRGIIAPTQKAVVRWFIIPKPGAGGEDPYGLGYRVGCNLSGKIKGIELPDDMLFAIPDVITVQPQPVLDITYFQPREVQGDDPFTVAVESPVPFPLGVLVRNVGYGFAHDVIVRSEQPRIVENVQGALLIPRLLGVRVMDSPLDRSSLTVNIGDLLPGETRKAAWDMITTLSGEFIGFKASYTHAPEFGGEETSLITNITAHLIAHEVLNDQAGRDGVLDFLADTDRDSERIPDAIYESEGQILPVNYLNLAEWVASDRVQVIADRSDWCYLRVTDPMQNARAIESVVRNDGKVLNPNNYWTSLRYTSESSAEHDFNERLDRLHIFDLCNLGTNSYTIIYAAALQDDDPPETTIEFSGEMVVSGGDYFITEETQIYFIATDESPVSMYYAITNASFDAAYPFRLSEAGDYTISYYSEDDSGNVEQTNTERVVVNAEAPAVQQFELSESHLLLSGDALTIRPEETRIDFSTSASAVDLDARIDIFQGIIPFVTVSNAPVSPTVASSATLYVGGENVDYYIYRQDAGVWSESQAVTQPLLLFGLANGTHFVEVLGRSEQGNWPAEERGVRIDWTVDAAGRDLVISGVPASPTRLSEAQLSVSGTNLTEYRWNLDDGSESYFRAAQAISVPFAVDKLTAGEHTVGAIGLFSGSWENIDTDVHTVSWTVDPLFGYRSPTESVRSVVFTNLGASAQSWGWDGKNEDGSDVLPGWYTVQLTLVDALSKTNFSSTFIQVEDLFSENRVLVAADRGVDAPYVRGKRAVWQDQSDGSMEIYTQNLADDVPAILQLTSGDFSQQNPKTDGRYAVWQGRSSDGSRDIYWADLELGGPAIALTVTPGVDEINPCIDWPWVVYQTKTASRPNDPWQLEVRNLLTDETVAVWPGPEDQLDPEIKNGRVAWQDWRDVGPGEIYWMDLETGIKRRITNNTQGQYHPVISDRWVVWQDNRNSQLDLYGYDFRRNCEVRISNTPENESDPFIDGEWVSCLEDSLGVGQSNVRMIHLPTLAAMPLTRSAGVKTYASVNGRQMAWLEEGQMMLAELPVLQSVGQTMNAVPVTPSMVERAGDAFSLLERWNAVVGVVEISRFSALVPTVEKMTARWNAGVPDGENFVLTAGDFIWLDFAAPYVADLGNDEAGTLSLAAGVTVFGYTGFPQSYSAHQMMRQLGLDHVRAIRMFDAVSGQWRSSEVRNGTLIGQDFKIPGSAVIWVDMQQAVNEWRPR